MCLVNPRGGVRGMVGQRENKTKKRKTKGPQAPNRKAKKQRGETSTRETHKKKRLPKQKPYPNQKSEDAQKQTMMHTKWLAAQNVTPRFLTKTSLANTSRAVIPRKCTLDSINFGRIRTYQDLSFFSFVFVCFCSYNCSQPFILQSTLYTLQSHR